MSLRVKFMLPVLMAMLLFFLALHFYWRPILMAQEEGEIVQHELEALSNMAPVIIRDLLTADLGAVYVTLDHLQEINAGEVYQVELFNVQGGRIYPLQAPVNDFLSSPYLLELEQRLIIDHEFLGTLRVKVDWRKRSELVNQQVGGIELTALVLFAFVLMTILILQEALVVRPLLAIKNASLRLAQGDFGVELQVLGKGEVSDLARSFDDMRQSLLATQLTLSQKVDEANRANQAKSEFLSRMSHELRTPMNAILGFGQMLELDAAALNLTQRDNINEILIAGRHLLDLINEVLDLAQIESGKLELVMSEVSVAAVVKQSMALMQPLAAVRHIVMSDQVSEKHERIMVDEVRFKQVLMNLLANAVKYNREGGTIVIDSSLVAERRLRVSVTDKGAGLSPEDVARLFIPFERLNMPNNVEGAGIGLVITKHLVELMGGTIGLRSVLGKGSTFWVEFELID